MKSALVLCIVFVSSVALTAAVASADMLQLHFTGTGTDGVMSAPRFSDHNPTGGENGWNNFNHNTGAQAGVFKFSLPQVDWYYPIAMFRADLSSIPSGSTINSAWLVIRNSDYNGMVWSNVEIRRIQVPGGVAWQPGNGTTGTRGGPQQDAGVGQWFADWQPGLLIGGTTNNGGVAWDGTLKDKYGARQTGPYNAAADASSALTTLITSGTLDAGAWSNTFTGLGPLVQDWVNGTYANEGFALSSMNATMASGAGPNAFSMSASAAGLFIDYTVPEPATMALLAFGGLGLLRRRRK